MTQPRRIDFSAIEPTVHDEGVGEHSTDVDGTRWALVEYSPGRGRADWCDTPHSGYLIGGALTYEFEDGREPMELNAGDAFALPEAPRHRGRNDGDEPARLFIIDALA